MVILGLGGLLSDGASAVLKDGKLIAAVEESKLARGARPAGMTQATIPQNAIEETLRLARMTREKVNGVAIVRPLAQGPEARLHLMLREQFPNADITVLDHHLAHAASAYFASPFPQATVLTLDHTGDSRCGARWRAAGNQLHAERDWYYPDSLGRLYGAVTELLGFHARTDEHKVQWLSTFGDDRFVPLFREIVTPAARLDSSFFDGSRTSSGGFSAKFYERLKLQNGARIPEAAASSVARGAQRALEETVLAMAGEGENLCLAGGLFYNALLVEFLERCGKWKNVFVQSAAGNAGTAIGAAAFVWRQKHPDGDPIGSDLLLGPSYGAEDIKQVLENCKLRFKYLRSTNDLLATAVQLLGERKIVAWMQGRMEFGPRALGNRSILAFSSNTASRSASSPHPYRRNWHRSTLRQVRTRTILPPWAV